MLVYHRVCPKDEIKSLKEDLAVDPGIFDIQMRSIRDRVISFEEAVTSGFSARDGIVITFDDGYKDNYKYAYPILKKYSLPATVFLSTNNIDRNKLFWWDLLSYIVCNTMAESLEYLGHPFYFTGKNARMDSFNRLSDLLNAYEFEVESHLERIGELLNVCQIGSPNILLSWQEVKEMHQNKITFGSHTSNHKRVSMIHDPETLATEILGSKSLIENVLGVKVDRFAYPYGRETDYDEKGIIQLRRAGYKYCFTGVADVLTPRSDLYQIPRVGISRLDSMKKFVMKTNSLYLKAYHTTRKLLLKDKVKSWV